jgi:hypothetical protein
VPRWNQVEVRAAKIQSMTQSARLATADLEMLLLSRLFVARVGERDVFNWWATDGILGPDGAFVGPRVLPKTHGTARARIAFAVARHNSLERYPDPSAMHLFGLDPVTEDRLDAYLVERLGAFDWWADILAKLEAVDSNVDLGTWLREAGTVTEVDLAYVLNLKLGPDDRSLPIEAAPTWEASVRRLAAGFSRSTPGGLAVPYLVGSMPPADKGKA